MTVRFHQVKTASMCDKAPLLQSAIRPLLTVILLRINHYTLSISVLKQMKMWRESICLLARRSLALDWTCGCALCIRYPVRKQFLHCNLLHFKALPFTFSRHQSRRISLRTWHWTLNVRANSNAHGAAAERGRATKGALSQWGLLEGFTLLFIHSFTHL